MNKTKRSSGSVGFVLCGTLAVALTGCTTYVEHRPARIVYVSPRVEEPPPIVVTPVESPVVLIQTESDFYEPLSPHGEWVVVGSYGRCWRPTRVEVGWHPYANGHWRRTDAGWYWASDEPWGWATYHYGRWDFSMQLGWIWVPQTQWAPAWVSWRQGAGYVGWAPLPPSARIGTRGIVEVHDRPSAPHEFVFVSEQRLMEPVRPTTVIVNNTTVINQTVNITKIQVVNKRVINEGPRPEVIERKSGRKVEAIPVHELRRKEETEVVTRQRNIPSATEKPAQPLVRTESAPLKTVPARETRQIEKPAEVTKQPQLPVRKNEGLGIGELQPSGTPGRSAVGKPLGNEQQRDLQRVNARPETEQTTPTRQPTTLTPGKQIEKRKKPEKPAAIKPGEVKKKKDEKKKVEEQEKPPQQPPARPQSPE